MDTSGVPFEGCEVKIEDPDKRPMSAASLPATRTCSGATTTTPRRDGRRVQGRLDDHRDAGYFDDKGRLVVIDRLKDIAETSGGDKFSPQYIENKIKFSYVGEAVVLGAGGTT